MIMDYEIGVRMGRQALCIAMEMEMGTGTRECG